MNAAPSLDRICCIAFDFDGTLVESNPVKRDAYYEVFAEVPGAADVLERVIREAPEANRYGVIGRTREELARAGCSALPPADELADAYGRICEERVGTCDAVPGAFEALEALAPHYPLYVDSATPQEPLRRVVARRGWNGFFRAVLGGPTDKVENLREVARREAVAPDAVLLVGDGPPDQRAAHAFGCTFAGFEAALPELAEHPRLAVLAPLARRLCARSAGWGAPRGRGGAATG